MKIEELKIKEELKRAIFNKGFTTLTEIQQKAIPSALEGKDILGQAQTGTGKTAAFGIPIIENIEIENKNIQALILVPTRELALQVCAEMNSLGKELGIKAVAIYGGDSIQKQIKDLQKAQVAVATPGRCIDLIDKNKLKVQRIKFFALDEVDEMLNMGFIDDVQYISDQMPEKRQTLLFSATMPKKIKDIANRYLVDPEIIKVNSKSIVADRVEQFYIKSKAKQKNLILKHLIDLNSDSKIIIFTQTKRSADQVSDFLEKQNIIIGKIHGDLPQQARSRTIQKFRDDHFQYLVATDIAARGLDIDNIGLVVNYELPQDIEYYIHRIGRTARGIESKGKAITLVSPNIYDREFKYYPKKLKVDIKEMQRPVIEDVINILQEKYKKELLLKQDTDEKVYRKMAKELLELEKAEDLLSKLLYEIYPQLSKIEHLKMTDALDDGQDESEFRGNRGNRNNNSRNNGGGGKRNKRGNNGSRKNYGDKNSSNGKKDGNRKFSKGNDKFKSKTNKNSRQDSFKGKPKKANRHS